VKESEKGDLSDFERGQVIGVCLARASLIKTATLLGVSRAAVPKVMLAYNYHGKSKSVKMNSEGKSTLTKQIVIY
jgi:hypothetical protein